MQETPADASPTKPIIDPAEAITGSITLITGSMNSLISLNNSPILEVKITPNSEISLTNSVTPHAGSIVTWREIPLSTQTLISHAITTLAIMASTIISISVCYGSDPSDNWARRWVLVCIPFVSAFGLLLGWRSMWRDTLLGMAAIYLFSPFVAARVESCWLPINGAFTCFAGNIAVVEMASQLAHPIYYPVLIGLHLSGTLFMWALVASRGGHYAPSTGTATD